MKRFLAILCFSAIITAGTELHQLFKLPVFLQHFQEHKKEDKDISLFSFIIMHYFKGGPRDKDYDRDMQLPFKTTDCTSALVSIVVPPHTITAERPEFFIKRSYPAVKNNSIQSSHLSDIWQPPKFS